LHIQLNPINLVRKNMVKKYFLILLLFVSLQGCIVLVDLAFYNNTDKKIEVCNLNLKEPACQTILAKSLVKVPLVGDIRLDAWYLTIKSKKSSLLYKIKFPGQYPELASNIYCQGIFNNRCDIPAQYEENELLYWGGKSQELPVKEFPEQPKGFPVKPLTK